MAIVDTLTQLPAASWLLLVPSAVVAGHVLLWLIDPHKMRSYPGPVLAGLSDVWLGRVAGSGHRSEVVHELHKQHGEYLTLNLPTTASSCPDTALGSEYTMTTLRQMMLIKL